MARRTLGIDAERHLRRILTAQGAYCIRAAASHGPCDIVAIGDGQVALIEVKATTAKRFYASRTTMQREQLEELGRIAAYAGCLGVVAVYFAQEDAFALFTPERALRGGISLEDAEYALDALRGSPIDSSPRSPPSQPCVAPGPPLDQDTRERLRELRRAADEV